MLRGQSLITIVFLLASSVSVHADWSQEIIQTTNVQFLDFSSEVNTDPFAIKIDPKTQTSDGEIVAVVNSQMTDLDPILAWGKAYGRQADRDIFGARYPIVVYYPIPIYYPVFYPVYAPYYFN